MKVEMELFIFVGIYFARKRILCERKFLLFYYLYQKLAKIEPACTLSDEQLLRALADRLGFDVIAR